MDFALTPELIELRARVRALVDDHLQPFEWVVPCGLDGVRMTSFIKETGRLSGQMKCLRRRVAFEVAQALGRRQRLVALARLEAALGAPQANSPAISAAVPAGSSIT